MKKYIFMAFVASLAACTPKQGQDMVSEGSELGFSIRLFKSAIAVSEKDENLTVSPYSAGVALSMLAEGAAGVTRDELEEALNGCTFRSSELGCGDTIVVNSANSVWIADGFSVKNAYCDLMSEAYDASAATLDFSDPSSVKVINDWCSRNTEGMIDGIVGRLNQDMKVILANALYFKAAWEDPFNQKFSRNGTFYGSKEDASVSFMYKKDFFGYAEYAGNQLISLPYKGGRYAMYVLLPSEELGVDGVLPYLSEEGLKTVAEGLERTKVQLLMPKFKLETSISLVKSLEAMGVRTVFTSAADLSEMADGPLAVSDVLQKTVVEVDEKGTEAAAVTAVMVGLTSAMPQQVVQMNVNRPFLYMIADMEAERILFAGKVTNL